MSMELGLHKPTLRKAQRGDAAAWERLYVSHRHQVCGIGLRMVQNPSDADDLMQESFVQFVRKTRTFPGDSAFSTWPYRVTKYAVLMHRRRKRLWCASLAEISNEGVDLSYQPARIPARGPSFASETQGLDLNQAVGKLPPACQRVFVLHDVFGYPHRAIGGITGLSESNSKSHLRRARMRLGRMLGIPRGRKIRNSGTARGVSAKGK